MADSIYRVDDFANFIKARELHRLVHDGLKAPSELMDPIISQYRFCNVRREDDRVTKWIAHNWRTPHENSKYIAFAMTVARLFNQPDTLADIEFPVPFRKDFIKRKLARRKERDQRIFNAAYIVSTNGRAMDKVEYVIDHVLHPMWKNRDAYGQRPGTLDMLHTDLTGFQGMGSFTAAQVVADVKYTPAYRAAEDWHTFAASGPGSRRGLNRVVGNAPDVPWPEQAWRRELTVLRTEVLKKLPKYLKDLHAQDIQNCLCEFDKYERARTGEGRPKQLYTPANQGD